jgi:Rab-GTPase-TBC domain
MITIITIIVTSVIVISCMPPRAVSLRPMHPEILAWLLLALNLAVAGAFDPFDPQEGVVPSMYCTHWFNTLFAYSLPFGQLLRLWDVLLSEGIKVRMCACSFSRSLLHTAVCHKTLCIM